MHLVTGRAGTPHINSDMVGRFNAGVIGSGSYIFNTQDQLACTIEDANTVSIATGDAVIQGRNVTNEAPVSLSVQSGAQSVSRYDLVCIRYENDGGIETASLVVITGTPSATPADPSYNDGSILDGALIVDIPIYRLVINGVSLDRAELLIDVITPYALNIENTGRLIFDGVLTVGQSVTIEGIHDYKMLAMRTDNNGGYAFAFSPERNDYRFVGLHTTSTPNMFLTGATIETDGNGSDSCRLTNLKIRNFNSGTYLDAHIIKIYGIL